MREQPVLTRKSLLSFQSMEQIRRIMRPTDVPDQGLLCDLLWSDPDKVKRSFFGRHLFSRTLLRSTSAVHRWCLSHWRVRSGVTSSELFESTVSASQDEPDLPANPPTRLVSSDLDLFTMNSKPAAAAILLLTASVQFGQLN
jgi:hypothetical protein